MEVTAFVIFMLLLPLFGFEHLFPFIPLSVELTQSALAQNADNNQVAESPEATAGNITADIKPQGTTLGVENVTSMEDRPEATAGNITADIKPQGTTLGVENVTSMEDRPEATAGNITADIKPQGTTLGVED